MATPALGSTDTCVDCHALVTYHDATYGAPGWYDEDTHDLGSPGNSCPETQLDHEVNLMTQPTGNLITVPTPLCFHCNKTGSVALPAEGLMRYAAGALVQEAFPDVRPSVREQFLSGTHSWCWDQMFVLDLSED